MKTVKDVEFITIVNKSKFIANLFYVEDINDIVKYLSFIKDKYKDATHHCYGYIINNIKKFNDDGEPNGTAGKPILDVLEKNNLNYVLCIVTRYFGGIKLGASGLLRAYSNSLTNAINNTSILDIINGYNVIIKFNYNKEKEINRLLHGNIINKYYDDLITYELNIDDNTLDELKKFNIDIKIIKEVIIKK